VALLGAILGTSVLGMAPSASAADAGSAPVTGTFDSKSVSGIYAACNVAYSSSTFVSGSAATYRASCQTSGAITVGSATVSVYDSANVGLGTGDPMTCTSTNGDYGYTCTLTDTVTYGPSNGRSINTGSNTSANKCSISMTIAGSARSSGTSAGNATGILCTMSIGTTYPTYPSDWFTGGASMNSAADVAIPTYTCTRTFFSVTASGQSIVKYTSTRTDSSTSSAFADTYSWAWGDGSAAGTAANPRHTFPVTVPESGWSTVLTVTRTLTSSGTHTFTDGGTSPKTVTCTLAVDPNDPSGTGLVSTDDSDCPSGWGWLNPAAIGSILKCLFIPTQLGSDFDALNTAASESYPMGPIIWAGTTLSDAYGGLQDGIADGDTSGCGLGASYDANGTEAGGTVTVPLIPCGEDSGLSSIVSFVRPALGLMFIIGTALALFRIGSWASGQGGSPIGGGEGEE